MSLVKANAPSIPAALKALSLMKLSGATLAPRIKH